MANSLKDLVSSVDWSKMFSGQDARNALIGSALGGLMLGGAGMMAKRDPEESKYAPVGDALVGALLGGVAGYGIPKGLALFRDSGRLAPDDDRMSYNNLGWGLGGAAAGVGAVGIGLRKTLGDVARTLVPSEATRAQGLATAGDRYYESVYRGDPIARQRAYLRRLAMHGGSDERAGKVLSGLRKRYMSYMLHRRFDEASVIRDEIRKLKLIRNTATRGYGSIGGLINEVGRTGSGVDKAGARALDFILHPRQWKENWTSSGHYDARPLLGLPRRFRPAARMGLRAGKYGAVGAAAGLLLSRLFGKSSHNNFKE